MWPTDRHTDRPRYSVCSNRPHLAIAVTRPNNNSYSNRNSNTYKRERSWCCHHDHILCESSVPAGCAKCYIRWYFSYTCILNGEGATLKFFAPQGRHVEPINEIWRGEVDRLSTPSRQISLHWRSCVGLRLEKKLKILRNFGIGHAHKAYPWAIYMKFSGH